jgi:hypothetical protein
MFDLSNPEVMVSIISDRPTMIEFTVPCDGFERPEAVLFQSVAEYLGSHALEPLNVDSFTIKYLIDENQQRLVIGAVYTRIPLPWIEFDQDS